MRHLFVGGPGRSGTSLVADRLGTHPSVAALKDIELKIFCEKDGLLDLHHALVETYSPNRAVVALDRFNRLTEALIDGRHGQLALESVAPAEAWRAAVTDFTAKLLADGHPQPQTAEAYLAAARGLLARIAAVTARACGIGKEDDGAVFLEKTPHNLLAIRFLTGLAPAASFLHVMRDARAIARSLLAMSWGPDSLATATRWVDSYCRAWATAEAEAAALGVALMRLHIEDVAAAPQSAAEWLTGRLDLAPRPGLFAGANPAVLARGAAQTTSEERDLLDRRLGGWAEHFGYAAEEIGRRRAPAFAGGETGLARQRREPA